MNARILKQYEDALKACRSNRLVDTSELPCPPGYAPLPRTENINNSSKSKSLYILSLQSYDLVAYFNNDKYCIYI